MNHTVISFENNEFYANDNNTKNGTYISCDNDIALKPNSILWAQIDSTLMSFEQKVKLVKRACAKHL